MLPLSKSKLNKLSSFSVILLSKKHQGWVQVKEEWQRSERTTEEKGGRETGKIELYTGNMFF